MLWWKRLSQSDARQETEGGLMPFRFTSENCPGDFVTWFREVFFRELEWHTTTRGENLFEEADINISVSIMGRDLGQKVMRLTHATRRHQNNSAPSTHLDFDPMTKEYLHNNDMTGKCIIFSKGLTSNFNLAIQDDVP
jgi:hypothetical protein